MREYSRLRVFGLTFLVLLLFISGCSQFQSDIPMNAPPQQTTASVDHSTSDSETSALFEAINPEQTQQECTHIEAHNCTIDISEYEVMQDTSQVDDEPPSGNTHNVDKLLLDYEIIFYQSGFEGETAQFSEIFSNGKPTVVVYWAGLCPVCKREMPEIQAAYEKFSDEVNFVGIDVGLFTNLGSREDALALVDELDLTYPLGVTLEFDVLPTYEITAIPTTLFMKPDGQIIRKESTYLDQNALFERIQTLLDLSQG